ncbi:hypothetical protein ACIQYW_14120 [Rhodococcus erythropolis]|uniref:hypothetical protein n=1 Tax=Bacillati TaxID=1783272 RepID=UPI003327DC6E
MRASDGGPNLIPFAVAPFAIAALVKQSIREHSSVRAGKAVIRFEPVMVPIQRRIEIHGIAAPKAGRAIDMSIKQSTTLLLMHPSKSPFSRVG